MEWIVISFLMFKKIYSTFKIHQILLQTFESFKVKLFFNYFNVRRLRHLHSSCTHICNKQTNTRLIHFDTFISQINIILHCSSYHYIFHHFMIRNINTKSEIKFITYKKIPCWFLVQKIKKTKKCSKHE